MRLRRHLDWPGLRYSFFLDAAIDLDAEAALQALMNTMAYWRIMDTKRQKMVEGDFRTQARLSQQLKDIRLILAAAAAAGQPLPLSESHCRLLETAEAAGFRDADNRAAIRAFAPRQAENGMTDR